MSNSILKPNTSIDDLERTLSLISLKIAKLTSHIEVYRGEHHLTPKQKIMFAELYEITNRHFIDDSQDGSLGKLYSDEEIERLKRLEKYYSF